MKKFIFLTGLFFALTFFSYSQCELVEMTDRLALSCNKNLFQKPLYIKINSSINKNNIIFQDDYNVITGLINGDFIVIEPTSNVFDELVIVYNQKSITISFLDETEIEGTTTPEQQRAPILEAPNEHGSIYHDAFILNESLNYDSAFAKRYGSFQELDPIIRIYFFEEKITQYQSRNLSSLSSVLGTDITHYASGISRFLAERAKDEMNEAFFTKMRKKMEEYPELKAVFPFTTEMLNNCNKNFGYSSVIQVLKDAFETDMQNIPHNLYLFKNFEYPDDEKFAKRKKALETFYCTENGQWFQLGLATLKETFESTNPAVLFNNIVNGQDFNNLKETLGNNEMKHNEYNILSFMELSNMISQSLLSCDENRVWITAQEFELLLKNPHVFKIYLGLMLATEQQKAEASKIKFLLPDHSFITFEEILIETALQFSTLEYKMKTLLKSAFAVYQSANIAIKNIEDATHNLTPADPIALYNYFRTVTHSIRSVAISIKDLKGVIVNLDKVENYLNPAADIVCAVYSQKYTSAIFSAAVLLNSLEIENANFKKVIETFITYGTFIASVATAQTSDEVKKAIEASVLPVGSAAMKRNSKGSIFLNAYVGCYYGWGKDNVSEGFKSYGLYAPIGISGSVGFRKCGALTLTLNAFDFGSLVNVYLREGDNAVLPYDFKVRLLDIISPGAQISYLIAQTPLSIFGGANYISKINTTENDRFVGGWRFQVGLAIDIPMYKIALWR